MSLTIPKPAEIISNSKSLLNIDFVTLTLTFMITQNEPNKLFKKMSQLLVTRVIPEPAT